MLTSSQLRAARALLRLTIDDLAASSGLSAEAIRDAEAAEAHADPDVTQRLQSVLASKGVVFLAAGEADGSGGPGVRLRPASQDEGLRPDRLNSANDG